MDEEAYKRIATLSREYMAEIWRRKKSGEKLGENEALIASVMEEHNQYHEIWDNIEQYAGRFFDPTREPNPFFHVSFHVTLERQIRANDPPCVRETIERLEKRDGDPHEARHAVMRALIKEVLNVLFEQRPFEIEHYCEELRKL